MDHQPKKLSEAQKAGIDIQLSGHTHNGQLFPLNFIVKRLFEVAQGYKKKGNTHIFVSPGVGTW
jgi:predicted MPP superfamily phosphohydrolase